MDDTLPESISDEHKFSLHQGATEAVTVAESIIFPGQRHHRNGAMGTKTYNGRQFRDLMNSNYYPLANMKKSVAKLKASDDIDLPTLEYGQYHLILTPASKWPQGSA
jgi:hypothetical protein